MSPAAAVRRWVHVLLDPPKFADYEAGFRFLADADAGCRGCGCKLVSHALSFADRALVATHLSVARAAAAEGDGAAACQVTYLEERLLRCPTVNPTARELADRAARDLGVAREVTR